ncbi:MAG: beta-galactosidase [Bryobacteraceae bacterium]
MEALTFVLRRGGGAQDATEQWHAYRSEAAVKKLQDAGVNFAIINFYKGAGIRAESEDIAAAREFTRLAHQHGIKVAGYVGATMMYETLFQEVPEARNWRQVDEFGNPIYYTNDQTFRYMACRNNPGYRAFIRKVVQMGIQDVKLDVIHFDQMQWWPEPHSCRCSFCQTQFRQFLSERYSDTKRARLRFGFTDFGGVIPPPYGIHEPPVRLAELHNPMMQEWALFRAWSLARDFTEFAGYIHGLNPSAAVIANPTMNLDSSVGFMYGVDPQQLFGTVDGVWTEEPNLPEYTQDGRLVSQIRSYKAARTMERPLFHWQDLTGYAAYNSTSPALRLAESLAYDDANLGVLAGGDAGGDDPPAVVRRYVKFFQSNLKSLVHTKEIADVAILRSFASNEFNPSQSNFNTVLFEQSLIQSKLPFAIIFNRQLSDLARYKVLVLADQDALSDEELGYIRKFVENGGGLVATGNSSLLTDWRTRREKLGLSDLFGFDLPPSEKAPGPPVQRQFGKGRVVYIPRIDAAVPAPPPQMNYYVRNALWKLPKNYAELISAVRWAAHDNFSATVDAPLWVTSELTEQASSGTRLLHLVNFKVDEPVANIPVRVRVPDGFRLRDAQLLDPDLEGPKTLEAQTQQGIVSFTVPHLNVYGLVLLHLRKE